ncbi:hypothetical protein ABW21_db0204973 [Orbilia brochopaga]|nr:hypothetical protein ABW21_db0204973 [Drechslerella brochopaga]
MARRQSVAPTPEPSSKRARTRAKSTAPPETEAEAEAESAAEATDNESNKSIASKKSVASKKPAPIKRSAAVKKSKAPTKASTKGSAKESAKASTKASTKGSEKPTGLRNAKKGRSFDDDETITTATPAKKRKIEGVFSRVKTLKESGLKYPPDFVIASAQPQRKMVTKHLTPTDKARAMRTTALKDTKDDKKDDAADDGPIDGADDGTEGLVPDGPPDEAEEDDKKDEKRPVGANGRRPRRTEAELLVKYSKQLPAIGKLGYRRKTTRSGKSFGSIKTA